MYKKIKHNNQINKHSLIHRSLVESLFYRTYAASRRSSIQIRIVKNDVGGKDREFLTFLSIKEGNESLHLVFWSLATLIGLRV
jgi:hypothetical protein